MKTLKEQVDEIIKSNKSKQTKSVSLVKLGLSPYEVSLLLGGKSSVRCPLKPSDSIPLCPNNPAH